jgi:LuxR family maltose regulon positive regulatory protein
MLRGLLLARQGEFAAAHADLERALALAEPEGYVRLFLEEGQPLQQVLGQWLSRAPDGAARDYARFLLSQFELALQAPESEPAQTASMGDWVEPLSARELEVLQLMAQGKTNKEIARQLFVAPGTVKAHSASIYRKLDVANRTAAVARARQLGILP